MQFLKNNTKAILLSLFNTLILISIYYISGITESLADTTGLRSRFILLGLALTLTISTFVSFLFSSTKKQIGVWNWLHSLTFGLSSILLFIRLSDSTINLLGASINLDYGSFFAIITFFLLNFYLHSRGKSPYGLKLATTFLTLLSVYGFLQFSNLEQVATTEYIDTTSGAISILSNPFAVLVFTSFAVSTYLLHDKITQNIENKVNKNITKNFLILWIILSQILIFIFILGNSQFGIVQLTYWHFAIIGLVLFDWLHQLFSMIHSNTALELYREKFSAFTIYHAALIIATIYHGPIFSAVVTIVDKVF